MLERLRIEQRDHRTRRMLQRIDMDIGKHQQEQTGAHRTSGSNVWFELPGLLKVECGV